MERGLDLKSLGISFDGGFELGALDMSFSGKLLGETVVVDGDFEVTSLGSELITNGDCEAAAASLDDDTTFNCSYAQSAEQAHGGSNSAKMVRTAVGTGEFAYSFRDNDPIDTLSLSKTYYTEYYFYLPSGQTANNIQLRSNASGAWATLDSSTTKDAWTKLSAYSQVLLSGDDVRIKTLGCESGDQNDYGYGDDFLLKEVTFDNWTLGDGAGPGTSAGALTNKVSIDGSQAAAGEVKQAGILTLGETYKIIYSITRSVGAIKVKCGTTSGILQEASGTYMQLLLCEGNTDLVFEYDVDFIGSLDTVVTVERL